MEPIQPQWVAILMALMTAIGAFLPKVKEFFTAKRKEEQEGAAFLIANYKDTILHQDEKLQKMESKLLEVQQQVVTIQTASIERIMENMKMKEQIKNLTDENDELRRKIAELERRIPK